VEVLVGQSLKHVTRFQLPDPELARKAQWEAGSLNERPAPRLMGVGADSTGVLWLTYAVADRRWRPGMDPRDDVAATFDTRIVAVRTSKRTVVGTARLDAVCGAVESNIISCVNDEDRIISVMALHLSPSGRGDR
jgi:hypothetical protein